MTNLTNLPTTPSNYPGSREGDNYDLLREQVFSRFTRLVSKDTPLFKTDAKDLFYRYLNHLPEEARSHYTCMCCKSFIKRYGDLVIVDENGSTIPVMWKLTDDVPTIFQEAIESMEREVAKAQIKDVFIPEQTLLGIPTTGEWNHFYVNAPEELVNTKLTLTAGQVMASKLEDRKNLKNSLNEEKFKLTNIKEALRLIDSEQLDGAEMFKNRLDWFKGVKEMYSETKHDIVRENLIWKAVATAPDGYCSMRNSMPGTIMSDIHEGLSFDSIKDKLKDKMIDSDTGRSKYMRAEGPASSGNIERAEEIIEAYGTRDSFVRRFARKEDIPVFIWEPKEQEVVEETDTLFGRLKNHGGEKDTENSSVVLPTITMTWVKFTEKVLPTAINLEYYVNRRTLANYCALTTAQNMDAPPIIKWDTIERRNPLTSYIHTQGSRAATWNLTQGYTKVTGICERPVNFFEEKEQPTRILLLEGAKDTSLRDQLGMALFPNNLKSEYHEVRSTMEEISNTGKMLGYEEASACGIMFRRDWYAKLRVTSENGVQEYQIDRWD